jgi:hypothetical protein
MWFKDPLRELALLEICGQIRVADPTALII